MHSRTRDYGKAPVSITQLHRYLRNTMSKIQARIDAIDTKVKELTAERVKLVEQLANVINEDDLQEGRTVTFDYGKGATRGPKTGMITGRKEAEGKTPLQLSVAVGDGFDAAILRTPASAVTKLHAEVA